MSMDPAEDGPTQIGRRMPRREDRRFLTGQGRYLDDIVFPGALHARFVRSPHAHARIAAIDVAAARRMPGVATAVTGHDLAGWATPLRMAPSIEGLHPMTMEAFPTAKVRFDGDLVACVVAATTAQAEDAAEQVLVEYDALPAVADVASALQAGAARVDDALDGNLVSHQSFTAGDPARRFAHAPRIVEARFHQHRQTHAPMETRGCCAVWDAGREHLTMHTGNQAPHPLRTQLALRLGLQESQVTVICPDIGGAFGQKIALLREELAVAALARALRRTVRWREGRGGNLMAASHAREQSAHTRAAVDADRLRETDFVTSTVAAGAGAAYLVARVVLPNALLPIIVAATLSIGVAILFEGGLSFLGLGDPDVVTWGLMLGQNRSYMQDAWWAVTIPGAAIFLAVLAVSLVGDGINDALNPRAQRR